MINRWRRSIKKLPDTDRRVFVVQGQDVILGWYENGEWYMTPTIKFTNVDLWMEVPKPPKDFDYWRTKLSAWWKRQVLRVEEQTYIVTGWAPRNAQLSQKVSFFVNSNTGEIMTGGPEHIRAPQGYERVIAGTTFEAEKWSARQRQWDESKHERIQEGRAAVEGHARDEIRKDLLHQMANARNAANREFIRRHLEQYDKKPDPWRYKRESYLHAEGYEKGH